MTDAGQPSAQPTAQPTARPSGPPRRSHLPPGYEPIRELGAGAAGLVTLARQTSVDRLVAVKTLLGGAHAGADAIARFRREARTLAAIDSPHVVRVIEFLVERDDLFLVLEYVDGDSLRDVMTAGPLPVDRALSILSDVAGALGAAAARGIVHRDVKPSNILVRQDGLAKLADFGLARLQADASAFRTAHGTVSGTPAYLSPEQAAGQTDVDEAADAYSFGVVAFEALVGQRPYAAKDVPGLLHAHRSGTPQSPTALVAGFPAEAARALLSALDKSPAHRPTPEALVASLRAVPSAAWLSVDRAAPASSVAISALEDATETAGTQQSAVPTVAPLASFPHYSESPVQPDARPPQPDQHHADVEPFIYRPSRLRPYRHWRVAVSALIVAIAIAAALFLTGREAVAILDISAAVSPQTAACPAAEFVVTATVHTNGRAGAVDIWWTRPDGTESPKTRLSLADGVHTVTAALTVSASGSAPFSGVAIAHTDGGRQASASIDYTCP